MKILIWLAIAAFIIVIVYLLFSIDLNPEVFTGASLI
jgi:hypothetical protein